MKEIVVRDHGKMSKRAEIHSSNIADKKSILRDGKEFKGQQSELSQKFRRSVSFAREKDVEDVLNASQLAQIQHAANIEVAAERERRTSCGEHNKNKTIEESDCELSPKTTPTSSRRSPDTSVFLSHRLSQTSTPRNLSKLPEFNPAEMSTVLTEDAVTEGKEKYVSTKNLKVC